MFLIVYVITRDRVVRGDYLRSDDQKNKIPIDRYRSLRHLSPRARWTVSRGFRDTSCLLRSERRDDDDLPVTPKKSRPVIINDEPAGEPPPSGVNLPVNAVRDGFRHRDRLTIVTSRRHTVPGTGHCGRAAERAFGRKVRSTVVIITRVSNGPFYIPALLVATPRPV